jgi:uridylate kinase
LSDESPRARRIRVTLSMLQVQRLEELATREDIDVREMAQRALEVGIEVLSSGGLLQRLRRTEAAAHLAAIRHEAQDLHGVYTGDPVAECRASRRAALEATWPRT